MDDKLLATFNLLNYINKTKRYNYRNGNIAWFKKNNSSFILEDNSIEKYPDEINIVLKNKKSEIIIPYFLSFSFDTKVTKSSISIKNTYKVSAFKTRNFNSNNYSFYRLCIPIQKRLRFFSIMEYDSILHTSFKVFDKHFDFYEIEDNKQNYLIIDSIDKFQFEIFADYCFTILISFGFISGHFFQDAQYYFCYDNPNLDKPIAYKFNSFRNSIFSLLKPICTNPASYNIKKFESCELKMISKKQFSTLCEFSINNSNFRMVLLQVIEASETSLLTSTFMLAVCLEVLVKIFLKKDDIKKVLSQDEGQIYNKVLEVLKKINCENGEQKEFLNIILSKIYDVGKNVSNIQKIYKLFKGINLNIREKEALKNRNNLLHGAILEIKGVKLDSEEKMDKAYWYLQLRLYTLVSAVILKNIGFSSKILNHYSFYEEAIGFFKLNESSYKDLS